MAAQTAAKPQAFVLKMRVVQPDGTPFFSRLFRVKWGEALFPPENKDPLQTDRDGALSVLLPAPPPVAPQGEVRFVERIDRTEIVVWSIPVQVAEPAPLFPFPALIESYVPPLSAAGAGGQPDLAERRRRYMEDAVRKIREDLGELYRFWGDHQDILGVLPPVPLATDPDGVLEQFLDEVILAYTAVVDAYQAAFRLWNMADLPLWEEPTIEMLSSDGELVLRAVQRFAFRQGLAQLPVPPTPESFKPILQRIQEVHDARGAIRPAKS